MQPLYGEDDLLERLLAPDDRRVAFLVGAAIAMPAVPGVTEMLALIADEYVGADTARRRDFEARVTRAPNPYQEAFSVLLGTRGPDSVNRVIRRAVLKARTATSALDADALHGTAEACRELEQDVNGWRLTPGLEALGTVTAAEPRVSAVLTPNFDPLIEVAIRKAGADCARVVLHGDGSLAAFETGSVPIVHFHGDWFRSDTLHTPALLAGPRPQLVASLRRLLDDVLLVVLGYGGWDDAFTIALQQVATDAQARLEVRWGFHEADWSAISRRYSKLLERTEAALGRRVLLHGGVDVHRILPRLAAELSAPARAGAAPAPGAKRPARDQLLGRLRDADGATIAAALLAGHWSLAELAAALRGEAGRAIEVLEQSARLSGDPWRRALGAYAVRTVPVPPGDLVELAFGKDLRWAAQFVVLSCLRFAPPAERRSAARLLAARYPTSNDDWDTRRLVLYGLGFVEGDDSIRFFMDQEHAYSSGYENEKLGPYAVMAFLHAYLFATDDYWGRGMLDDFVSASKKTAALGNLRLTFFDYLDELQTMSPGKGTHLFRNLRDHQLDTALSAVLAALNTRPNPLLLDELVELGLGGGPRATHAIHSAGNIGTLDAARRLLGPARSGAPGPRAAYLLAAGLSGWMDAAPDVEGAATDAALSRDASWNADVWHNALWAAGELGRQDRPFAVRLLEPGTRDAHQPHARGLCWMGLAKAGHEVSRERYAQAFEVATDFFEGTLVAIAAAQAGWPELLAPAIRGTIDNASPIYRMLAHVARDLRATLRGAVPGGPDLVTLADLGDFT